MPYTASDQLLEGRAEDAGVRKINPNGRIPAIIDRANGDLAVFERGAILLYLGKRSGKLLPKDDKGESRVTQWLMFQMAGIRHQPDDRTGECLLSLLPREDPTCDRPLPDRVPAVVRGPRRAARRPRISLRRVLDRRHRELEHARDTTALRAWSTTHCAETSRTITGLSIGCSLCGASRILQGAASFVMTRSSSCSLRAAGFDPRRRRLYTRRNVLLRRFSVGRPRPRGTHLNLADGALRDRTAPSCEGAWRNSVWPFSSLCDGLTVIGMR
jgi:hypothetical protein